MSEDTKHTPAPWIAHGGNVYAANEAGYNRMGVHIESGWVKQGTVRTSKDELAANANLIAAAPDLLAAAKEITRWVETRPATHPYDAWKMLNAAIAKAEGRS